MARLDYNCCSCCELYDYCSNHCANARNVADKMTTNEDDLENGRCLQMLMSMKQ